MDCATITSSRGPARSVRRRVAAVRLRARRTRGAIRMEDVTITVSSQPWRPRRYPTANHGQSSVDYCSPLLNSIYSPVAPPTSALPTAGLAGLIGKFAPTHPRRFTFIHLNPSWA